MSGRRDVMLVVVETCNGHPNSQEGVYRQQRGLPTTKGATDQFQSCVFSARSYRNTYRTVCTPTLCHTTCFMAARQGFMPNIHVKQSLTTRCISGHRILTNDCSWTYERPTL